MPLVTFLTKFFRPATRERGVSIAKDGSVSIVHAGERRVLAKVRGTGVYSVEVIREGKALDVYCTCPYFEMEGECKHIWATLLVAERQGHLQAAELEAPTSVDPKDELDEEDEDISADEVFELLPPEPHLSRLGARLPGWAQTVENLCRFDPNIAPDTWPVNREIYYLLMGSVKLDRNVGVRVCVRDRLKNGGWGKLRNEHLSNRSLSSVPDVTDREILLSLVGQQQTFSLSRTDFRAKIELVPGQSELLLPKMCQTGRCLLQTSLSEEPKLNEPLRWEGGKPWRFRLTPVPEGQYWRFSGYFHREEERLELQDLRFASVNGTLATSSMITCADPESGLHWLDAVWPNPKLLLPVRDIGDFLVQLSRAQRLPEIEWPKGFELEERKEAPRPRLTIVESPAASQKVPRYRASLQFDYPEFTVPPFHNQCHYDKASQRLTWRDMKSEAALANRLLELGASPQEKRDSGPYSWEIRRNRLTHLLSELHTEGWSVETEGKAFRRAGEFEAELSTGIDWFDLNGSMNFEGQIVSLPRLLASLARNEQTVILPDGSVGLLPTDFIEKFGVLAGLGSAQGETIRFQRSQVGLLDALLATRPEVKTDQLFKDQRARISSFEGIGPAQQPDAFVGVMRDYQREGLAWLLFLQDFGFGGCLADDMGVGKTVQILALLETRRELRMSSANGARPGPSLVIAPRSVIFNWKQEAARFTPQLRVLDYAHSQRRESFKEIESHDVVLATYGTLRQDIVELRKVRFDYAILDEAQAIKNAGSDSAKAARLLNANHRLVMSGTPVENHLGELGSLFEFLNPGMLGSGNASALGARSLRNADDNTRIMLGRALRPFILRRTKGQVARELPSKTEQTIYCEMGPEQRKLYNELRDHYRQSLLGRIDTSGIGKSRMHILEALLRLRQAACHPGLIDAELRHNASAKLDAVIPQIREVIEGGHKLLVFSQFTSFLSIVRDHLHREEIRYTYLDGQTTDRQACVEQFQNDPAFPVFLISLKAGGLGLNLTAAEYVFLLDPWWNPAVEAQAIDRTHRIGQTNQVFAYRLITRDTVEEKVMDLQARKRALADAILTVENSNVNTLSRDDLEILLS